MDDVDMVRGMGSLSPIYPTALNSLRSNLSPNLCFLSLGVWSNQRASSRIDSIIGLAQFNNSKTLKCVAQLFGSLPSYPIALR